MTKSDDWPSWNEAYSQALAERDKAIAERDSWKAEAQKWVRLHEELAEPLLFEQRRDSFGPTEEMPETVKRIIAERDAAEALLLEQMGPAEDVAEDWIDRTEALLKARKLIPEGK